MNNIAEGGFERCISEDILEEHRGVDRGVETRRDTDDNQAGREKTLEAPDVEWHDWVVDLVLDEHECDKEDQADDEGSQGLGGCPTTSWGLGQIDHTDDAAAEGADAEIVDAAVGYRRLALLRGNNDEPEDDQKRAKHGCNVKHPSPT